MYMVDYDLRQLEMQLHGFDAALAAVGKLAAHGMFNRDFTDYVHRKTEISGSRGWAIAPADSFGAGKAAFDAFCSLLSDALPVAFNPSTFEHE
jgi:hypothetical protein